MKHLKTSLFILLLLCLTGCSYNPQPIGKPLPKLTYEHLYPYQVYGGATQIRQSFEPTKRMNEVISEFPIAPGILLERYAAHRFVTQGTQTKMVFNIERAAIAKKSDDENIIGFLSGAAENAYLLDIYITMSPVAQNGSLTKPFTIAMKRELFLPQRISLAEREMRQFEFLEKAIVDIDAVVTKFVQERML